MKEPGHRNTFHRSRATSQTTKAYRQNEISKTKAPRNATSFLENNLKCNAHQACCPKQDKWRHCLNALTELLQSTRSYTDPPPFTPRLSHRHPTTCCALTTVSPCAGSRGRVLRRFHAWRGRSKGLVSHMVAERRVGSGYLRCQ